MDRYLYRWVDRLPRDVVARCCEGLRRALAQTETARDERDAADARRLSREALRLAASCARLDPATTLASAVAPVRTRRVCVLVRLHTKTSTRPRILFLFSARANRLLGGALRVCVFSPP